MSSDIAGRVATLARAGLAYRNYVLVLLMLIFAIQYLDRQVVVILAQPIKAEFGLTDAQMGLLTGFIYSVPYCAMLIPMGMLADRKSRRNILVIALGLWSCLTFVTGFVRSLSHLIAIRVVIAGAESVTHPSALSLIADLFDRSVRATAIGIYYAGPALASVLGFPLIAAVADHFGWRAGFFAAGIPGLLVAVLVLLTVREPPREGSKGAADAPPPPSLGASFAYMWVQRSSIYMMIAMMLTSVVNSGQIMWMVAFLMRAHSLSLPEAALAVSLAFGATNAFGNLIGGGLTDWLARTRNVGWYAVGPGLFALMTMIFQIGGALVPEATLAIAMLSVWSLAAGFQYGPVMGTVQSLVKPQMRGVASAALAFFVNLVGAGFGPYLVGVLSDGFEPSAGIRSLQLALAVVALLHVVVIFFFFLAARRVKSDLARSS